MIMGSWNKLKIGSIHNHIRDGNLEVQHQPFRVIREASFDEWYNQEDVKDKVSQSHMNEARTGYFYEISLD